MRWAANKENVCQNIENKRDAYNNNKKKIANNEKDTFFFFTVVKRMEQKELLSMCTYVCVLVKMNDEKSGKMDFSS